MRILCAILFICAALTSCFQEDEMIPPHEPGNVMEGSVALGSEYEHQVFFDLNRNLGVASNLVSDWDLSFESANGGWIIRLNSSKFMYAGTASDTVFMHEFNKSELDMRFDASHGDPDSTALAGWYLSEGLSFKSNKYVYLVDRGSDHLYKPVGLKKVQFDMEGEDYLVRYANPDNSGDTTIRISRDPSKDQIYFSFDNGVVQIAPGPDDWSLLFSKYTTMLVTDDGENYPYIVLGVLLNPNGVTATLDTIHHFQDLELADTIDIELTNRNDVIGYEWKSYNFDAGLYTVKPGLSYVIRDRDGFYYKLKFVDFYSDGGEKGYPRFEYVRL